MKQIVPLTSSWQVMHAEPELGATAGCSALPLEERWVAAQVPGEVHLDYLAAGMIPDPFFGTNHDRLRWMEEMDWWYRTEFTPPAVEDGRRLHLLFEGLDVFATVYINGEEVGRHRNMFTPLRIDITDRVKPGANRLEICLGAPVLPPGRDLRQPEVRGYGSPLRLHVRKVQSSYGWNISPRLVTIGIWKPVSFVLTEPVELADVFVDTLSIEGGAAEVEALVEVQRHLVAAGPVECELTVAGQTRTLTLTGDSQRERFTIENAQRWWPHDHGAQPLYDWSAVLRRQGRELDRKHGRFGVRTVELIQEPDADGGMSFVFAINGKKIFAKGMNWTPADAIPSRVTDERYRQLLVAAKEANINALRVWGGGMYENDGFYTLCDELGLLVTHDFMYACGCYPQDADFLAEARREAEYVVRRLRGHPSMTAWFGDNENDVLSEVSYNLPQYRYNALSKQVLPSVVRMHAPRTPYVPSSPYSPRAHDQNLPEEGDCHLWHHGFSYRDARYTGVKPRMTTEIGHLAMPPLEVVEAFVAPENRWPVWNEEYLTHGADCWRLDRQGRFRTLWESIRARGWEEPVSLEDLIDKTQRLQAEATKFWVEFYGAQPTCWGIFLWNLADSWPQMSDAYIAYPFHPKPGLTAVREAYGALKR